MTNNDDPENTDQIGPQYPSPGTIFTLPPINMIR